EYFRERHRSNACIVLCNLAAYSLALDRPDDARTYAREGLALARELHLADLIALAIQHLASVAMAVGDLQRAAVLAGYVDARYAALGIVRDTSEQYTYERLRSGLQAAMSAGELARAQAEGEALGEDRAIAESSLV